MTGPPGAQAQRTVLAWDRTALALLVNGALLLLRAARTAGPAALAVAGFALVAALVVAVLGRRRGRTLDRRARPPAAGRALTAAGVAVVAVGVGVTTVLLVGGPW